MVGISLFFLMFSLTFVSIQWVSLLFNILIGLCQYTVGVSLFTVLISLCQYPVGAALFNVLIDIGFVVIWQLLWWLYLPKVFLKMSF